MPPARKMSAALRMESLSGLLEFIRSSIGNVISFKQCKHEMVFKNQKILTEISLHPLRIAQDHCPLTDASVKQVWHLKGKLQHRHPI